jgi:hypothetical protein
MPHEARHLSSHRHGLGAFKRYAQPIGNRLDHEPAPDTAAREGVQREAQGVGR